MILTVLIALPVALAVLYYILHLYEVRKVSHIPGISYPHLIWLFFNKKNNFFLFPRELKHLSQQVQGSKIWRITLGRDTWIFTKDPETIREICVTKHKDYRRDKAWRKANMVNTRGNVLVTHGDEWKQHRTFLNPSFSDTNMKYSYEGHILSTFDTLFERWNKKISTDAGQVNASYDINCLISDVFGKVALGVNYDTIQARNKDEETEPIIAQMLKDVTFVTQFLVLFPWGTSLAKVNPETLAKIPLLGWVLEKVSKTTRQWRGMLKRDVDERCEQKATAIQGTDILSVLARTILDPLSNESDAKFDKEDIISEIHVLASAGLETTTHTLEWLCYYMARRMEIQQKLVQDIQDTIAKLPNHEITYEALMDQENFKYVRAVINETLRVRGPVPNIWRYTRVDTVLAGKTIPENTHVYPMFCLVNKDPTVWGQDAEEFRPERFLEKEVKSHVFSPFSFGPRACVGKKLAEIQLLHFVVSVFKTYKIELPENESKLDDMEERMAMTMGPMEPIMIKLSKR
jgi:cytochrome P450